MDAEASLLCGLSREAAKGKSVLAILKPLGAWAGQAGLASSRASLIMRRA